jgi:hypothetical protein
MMNKRTQIGWFLLALGCGAEPIKESAPPSSITGSLSLDEWDGTAAFELSRGFAFHADGQFVAYLSSQPSTTCADAAAYLSGTVPFAKDDLMRGGTCAMTIVLDEPYPFEGNSTEWGPVSESNPGATVAWAIECAMGEGAFALETFDGGEDYRWNGRWWRGYPYRYSFEISGNEEGATRISLDMSEFGGALPYDAVYQNVWASGSVSGTISAKWCPALSDAVMFDRR